MKKSEQMPEWAQVLIDQNKELSATVTAMQNKVVELEGGTIKPNAEFSEAYLNRFKIDVSTVSAKEQPKVDEFTEERKSFDILNNARKQIRKRKIKYSY